MNKIIFTNGCFDVLHAMHFNLLVYCRYLAVGGKVVLALDSDEKIRKDKGSGRPIFSFSERKEFLLSLKDYFCHKGENGHLIDDIFEFNTNEELYEIVKNVQPSYIVKGTDWNGNVVGSDVSEVIYYPYSPRISSSYIVERIQSKR